MDKNEIKSIPFLENLNNLVESSLLKKNIRLVFEGLFINEAFMDTLLEKYNAWLSTVTNSNSNISKKKLFRRLFKEENPTPYCLLEGKLCFTGFIVKIPEECKKKLNFIYSQSTLFEAKNYLHPNDPKLETYKDIKPFMHKTHGLCINILDKYSISINALKEFATISRISKEMIKRYPDIENSLISLIEPAKDYISKSHNIKKNSYLLVPSKLKKTSYKSFLKSYNFIFIKEKESNIIKSCYFIKGKPLSILINKEITEHKSMIDTSPSKNKKKNPKILGKLRLRSKTHLVYKKAFINFMFSFLKVSRVKKDFPHLYTINDCVKQFNKELKNAMFIPQKERNKKVLKSSPFIFEIEKNVHIVDCKLQKRKKSSLLK